MKKLLTTMFSAALVLSAAAAAAQQETQKPNRPPTEDRSQTTDQSRESSSAVGTFEGTVSQVDESGQYFVLRDSSGKEVTIHWDRSTLLVGPETKQETTSDRSGQTPSSVTSLKVGDQVVVSSNSQAGKNVAASVQVRPTKSKS